MAIETNTDKAAPVEIDFAAAEMFLAQAKQAQAAGNIVLMAAACKMVAVALTLDSTGVARSLFK